MAGAGRVKMAMWEGGALWVLDAEHGLGDMADHAHHAVQVTCLLGGTQTLRAGDAACSAGVAAVDADVPHRLALEGLCAILFIDPDGGAGRAIRRRMFAAGALAEVDPQVLAEELGALREAWAVGAAAETFGEIGRRMSGKLELRVAQGVAEPPDARVARILSALETRLEDQPSLRDCADGIHLSESRLRHLFAEETGLPFKSYVLWRRLARAVEVYAAGASLTEAAHEAGFADSAHFSRTFRRTFGLPATTLART